MNRREMIVGSILGLFWRKPKFRIPVNETFERVELIGPTIYAKNPIDLERQEFLAQMAKFLKDRGVRLSFKEMSGAE